LKFAGGFWALKFHTYDFLKFVGGLSALKWAEQTFLG